jgi:hypothetical protein
MPGHDSAPPPVARQTSFDVYKAGLRDSQGLDPNKRSLPDAPGSVTTMHSSRTPSLFKQTSSYGTTTRLEQQKKLDSNVGKNIRHRHLAPRAAPRRPAPMSSKERAAQQRAKELSRIQMSAGGTARAGSASSGMNPAATPPEPPDAENLRSKEGPSSASAENGAGAVVDASSSSSSSSVPVRGFVDTEELWSCCSDAILRSELIRRHKQQTEELMLAFGQRDADGAPCVLQVPSLSLSLSLSLSHSLSLSLFALLN